MERSMIEARLAELRREFDGGQKLLRELEGKQMEVRDTLLRIGGAMQVLEELLASAPENAGSP
ncbi:hypothetical protein [Nannocystis bainbridge]|uniref:Uncharacterized protein n=1 Tax=Nannocystis bainbridge TaxID=2995303 RepID=A0ABT5E7G0_9BACT|nr:hypothetical protein [Nannocystis bainbridge]MDC0720706.1 hypothetical protein [Nannocystis bainbridge]